MSAAAGHAGPRPALTPKPWSAPTLLSFSAIVNFLPAAAAAVPAGYVAGTGLTYRAQGGLTFGWTTDNTANTPDRNSTWTTQQKYDTLNHMQLNGSFTRELAVPAPGNYQARIVAGDADNYASHVYKINAESTLTVDGTPKEGRRRVEGTKVVSVTDGKPTIRNATEAAGNKSAFIKVKDAEDATNPVAPVQLTVAAAATTTADVRWLDVSQHETSFKVERKTGTGGTWAQVATPAANATYASVSGMSADTTCFFRIRASNAAGDSDYSEEVSIGTPPTAAQAPYGGVPGPPARASRPGITTPAANSAPTTTPTASTPAPRTAPATSTSAPSSRRRPRGTLQRRSRQLHRYKASIR